MQYVVTLLTWRCISFYFLGLEQIFHIFNLECCLWRKHWKL